MINATELRIGNKILRGGKVVTVSKIDDCREEHYSDFLIGNYEDLASYIPKEYNPIPLTSEILEQCGFVKDMHPSQNIWSNDLMIIFFNEELRKYYTGYWKANFVIDSLHQLQNIYHSLTGEELEIKELQHA